MCQARLILSIMSIVSARRRFITSDAREEEPSTIPSSFCEHADGFALLRPGCGVPQALDLAKRLAMARLVPDSVDRHRHAPCGYLTLSQFGRNRNPEGEER